jgi:thiamine-phosphate diphosphorylase
MALALDERMLMTGDALRLVAITDNLRDGIDGLVRRARAARRGGATMIHLRLPDECARTLAAAARALMRGVDVPVIVHGRADVALAAGAAGVHLAVHDIEVADVRQLTGDAFVIGRSVASENDLHRATAADYVTLGPVFPAADRLPEPALGLSEFERLARACPVPVVAIGGISAATAVEALRAGARGVALISAVFGSRDPEKAAREVRSAIGM